MERCVKKFGDDGATERRADSVGSPAEMTPHLQHYQLPYEVLPTADADVVQTTQIPSAKYNMLHRTTSRSPHQALRPLMYLRSVLLSE